MTPEDEEFNRIEMESRIKQDYVRDIKQPSREQLMAEVAVLTELVRVLSGRVAELEKPWVDLTDGEVEDYWYWEDFQTVFIGQNRLATMVRDIEAKLKEKNNG
jgi:hypothetical protein